MAVNRYRVCLRDFALPRCERRFHGARGGSGDPAEADCRPMIGARTGTVSSRAARGASVAVPEVNEDLGRANEQDPQRCGSFEWVRQEMNCGAGRAATVCCAGVPQTRLGRFWWGGLRFRYQAFGVGATPRGRNAKRPAP